MSKPRPYPFYSVWSGSLNMGDTPGVFNDSAFVGLILQIPVSITFIPEGKETIEIFLVTTEVEIFNGNAHNVYFDWVPGTTLPNPIGKIDDVELIPNFPEYHLLKIAKKELVLGNHTITILVNTDTPAGLRDDFVLIRMDVSNDVGVRIGAM